MTTFSPFVLGKAGPELHEHAAGVRRDGAPNAKLRAASKPRFLAVLQKSEGET